MSSYTLIAPGAKTTVDDGDQDYDGWYCLATPPWPCACGTFIAHHVTAMHLILLWPESDDLRMLKVAKAAQLVERDPKVVEYKTEFGPAVSFYEWEAHGRPVHK